MSLAFLVLTKTPLDSIFEKNFGLKVCPIFTSIPVFGTWHAIFGSFAIAWYRAQCLKQSLRLRVPRMSRKLPVVILVLTVLLTLGVTVVFVTTRHKSFSGSICYGYHEDYLQIVQAKIALCTGENSFISQLIFHELLWVYQFGNHRPPKLGIFLK